MIGRRIFLLSVVSIFLVSGGIARDTVPAAGPRDKCAVCGMFVNRHPDWLAVMEFHDQPPLFFCGPKDALKFIQFPDRYLPQVNRQDFKALHLKDYYSLSLIDGLRAVYVAGSRILGPMGNELVPFADAEAAAEFMENHNGRLMVPFEEITPQLLLSLD